MCPRFFLSVFLLLNFIRTAINQKPSPDHNPMSYDGKCPFCTAMAENELNERKEREMNNGKQSKENPLQNNGHGQNNPQEACCSCESSGEDASCSGFCQWHKKKCKKRRAKTGSEPDNNGLLNSDQKSHEEGCPCYLCVGIKTNQQNDEIESQKIEFDSDDSREQPENITENNQSKETSDFSPMTSEISGVCCEVCDWYENRWGWRRKNY